MALEHTPIETESLSPAAQKALAPGPMQMMAARGLAPLADPVDLLTVLYQLAVSPDVALSQAAAASFSDLPENVFHGALSSPNLDGRVLDFAALKLADTHPAMLEVIILNASTADLTIAELAGRGSARTVDLIAQNEQRLLSCPDIIASMYQNRVARMSTVDRAVELAIHNQIKVQGIPAWDELVNAVKTSGRRNEEAVSTDAMDAAFAKMAAQAEDERGGEIVEVDDAEGETEDGEIRISQMTVPMKIRLATLGNAFARGQLIRDPIRMVALAAIKSPGVTDAEASKYATNNSLHEDVISYIANRREWTKLYSVKLSLVKNPKTPLASSMRLLPHIRERELRLLSKSKGVPSALAAGAKKLLMNRSRGGGK